jgi:radical SAM superfamily enzyme YgiQ (UPF0313 family)
MKKNYTVDKIKMAVESCKRNGILIVGTLIVPNIGENADDVRKNYKLIKNLKLDTALIDNIMPFPGTQLYEDAIKNGWIPKDFKFEEWDGEPFMRTNELTVSEIKQLLNECPKSPIFNMDLFGFFNLGIRSLFDTKYSWIQKYIPTIASYSLKKIANIFKINK